MDAPSFSATEAASLRAVAISKAFGGVHALRDVCLTLRPGAVHALVGENGAGKSTLIKVLAGLCVPDAGTVSVGGRALRLGDVRASEATGIAVIHQDAPAFAHLDAGDNIFVGREPRRCWGLLRDGGRIRRQTEALLERLGERFDPGRPVGQLSPAQRQVVGIARALSRRSCILIMDEPTASLSARETDALFRIVRQLRDDGASILYVSHRMDEVFELADSVTVLRDGRLVDTVPVAQVTRGDLIRMMIGRPLGEAAAEPARELGPPVLEVAGLGRRGSFQDVSLTVRAGEIVALSGLVGAGRSEVARAIFGIDRAEAGTVSVGGRALRPGSVPAAIEAGVALVPEDRTGEALVGAMSVGQNLTLAVMRQITRGGLISRGAQDRLTEEWLGRLAIRAAGPGAPVWTLSGGNQQKVVLAKWLAARPRVLILDEPTRGVDVGAKAQVHDLIRSLAREGMATLVISSDLPEVLALGDRVLVMRGGRISGQLQRGEATQEQLLRLALPEETRAEGRP